MKVDTPEITAYRKKLTLLGALGMPFYIAFALGALAHFKGQAVFPFLKDSEIAFTLFVVGLVGALFDIAMALYCVVRIKRLENENI